MKRWVSLFVIVTALLVMGTPAVASSPVISGELSGVEICPQAVCGAAIFTGTFHGLVGRHLTAGYFWVAAKHDPLPDPGNSAAITGGKWNITTPGKLFAGKILSGTLYNNGDNTFKVDAVLELDRGGSGDVLFSGLLNHNDFPPTIEGDLSQP